MLKYKALLKYRAVIKASNLLNKTIMTTFSKRCALLFIILFFGSQPLTHAQTVSLKGNAAIDLSNILLPIEPPEAVYRSSSADFAAGSQWYRLDFETSPVITEQWLLVFRKVPHQQLDIFIPENDQYRLKKLGMRYFSTSSDPRVVELNLKPGESKTVYIRVESPQPNRLQPMVWPEYLYTLHEYKTRTSITSIQTLLIAVMIFVAIMSLRSSNPGHLLVTAHLLAANTMILMWQGDIFRQLPWTGDPGNWVLLLSTITYVTGIACYRNLSLLALYTPTIDKVILSGSLLATGVILYFITFGNENIVLVDAAFIIMAITSLLLILALIVCIYNGIKPAQYALPAALATAIAMTISWGVEPWPRNLPTLTEELILSLQALILATIYWQNREQRLQHAMAISVISSTTQKRRIFESALREHLQNPESPLATSEIPERVLSTVHDVLPGTPALILIHEMDEWNIVGEYSKAAENLRRQLPTVEADLFQVINSGSEAKINFRDRLGSTYWVFPLNIESSSKTLLALAPPRSQRNPIAWQTACDISSHARTLFQASKQSHFWQQQASLDPLTGLLNRRAFYNEAETLLAKKMPSVKSERFFGFCALFIDLDDFKLINDRFGHGKGDQILRGTATLCRRSLRQYDLIGRYGGEEIVVFLPGTDATQGFLVAERIRSNIEKAGELLEDTPITVSIGLSEFSESINTLDKLLEEADKSMYLAKQQGKNRVIQSSLIQSSLIQNPLIHRLQTPTID